MVVDENDGAKKFYEDKMKMKSNGCWLKPLKWWAPFDNDYKPNDKKDTWSTRRIKWREYIREFDEYPGEATARAKV